MINSKHSNQLKELYFKYNKIHNELSKLEKEVQSLLNLQTALSQELNETRNKEKELINKLELEINRKITQEDLHQIIKSYE